MKQYNISYVRNNVPQTILVEAISAEIAERYFKHKKPDAKFCGIHEATADDMKPGKPVMLAKTFEVWKDCELGQTYREEAFFTKDEADEWINKMERYYPGWHLRIVEAEEVKYIPKKYSDYFMMDGPGVDRMTINAAGRSPEIAEKLFYDKFGYFPDVVKTLDKSGGVVDVIKDVRDGIDRLIDSAKNRSNEMIGNDEKTTDFVKE